MYQREPVLRLTRPGDLNCVTTMDLRCYPYPLTLEEWREKLKGSGKDDEARVVVVEVKGKPAGFAMWSIDHMEMVGMLHRLGVLPQHRRRRLGTLLMAGFIKHCGDCYCDKAKVTVPHIHCQQGDPDDVSAFLHHVGFQATGEVKHDYKEMYGDLVDGYVFERGTDAISKL